MHGLFRDIKEGQRLFRDTFPGETILMPGYNICFFMQKYVKLSLISPFYHCLSGPLLCHSKLLEAFPSNRDLAGAGDPPIFSFIFMVSNTDLRSNILFPVENLLL